MAVNIGVLFTFFDSGDFKINKYAKFDPNIT